MLIKNYRRILITLDRVVCLSAMGGKERERSGREGRRKREEKERERKKHCFQWYKSFHMVLVCQNISVGVLPEHSTPTHV